MLAHHGDVLGTPLNKCSHSYLWVPAGFQALPSTAPGPYGLHNLAAVRPRGGGEDARLVGELWSRLESDFGGFFWGIYWVIFWELWVIFGEFIRGIL